MAAAASSRQLSAPQSGPFILRKLVSNLPLAADGASDNIHITCVEVWST